MDRVITSVIQYICTKPVSRTALIGPRKLEEGAGFTSQFRCDIDAQYQAKVRIEFAVPVLQCLDIEVLMQCIGQLRA